MKRAESAKRIRSREIRKLAEDRVACEARVEHGPSRNSWATIARK